MTLSSTIARNNPYTKPVNARSERVTKVVLEWNIPQEVKKVSVVPLLTNLLTRAKTVGTVMFLDTKLEEFDLEDLDAMQPEDLTNRFMAESVKVKDGSKVLLGMSIRSTSTLEEVKIAIGYEWLKANRIYLRIQTLGFDHGLEMFLLGYFVKIHPSFVNYGDLKDQVYEVWKRAHAVLSNSTDSDIQQQLKHAYDAGILFRDNMEAMTIPIGLEKSVMPGIDSHGKSFHTSVITLRVPKVFIKLATILMDVCVLSEDPIANYIPYGLKKEDTTTFRQLARAQAKWIDNHRNIQIREVSKEMLLTPVSDLNPQYPVDSALYHFLQEKPGLLGTHYHDDRQQLNLSVDKNHYELMLKWVDEFFKGFRVTDTSTTPHHYLGYNHSRSSNGHDKKGKYSAMKFQLHDFDATYNPPARSNAWSRGPPVSIIVNTADDSSYPSLTPGNKTPASDSTTKAYDTFTLDDQTVRTIIADELKKFTTEQEKRVDDMKQQFSKEITRMETQFQQTATTTLKETLAEFGIATTKKMEEFNMETTKHFTTQYDFEELTRNVQQIAAAVNLLIANVSAIQPTTDTAPSPPRKQTRSATRQTAHPSTPGTTPIRNLDADMEGAGDDL